MSKPIRCAIYTRKSSEEGLDQAYNSLDAQRDACAAYVLSQAGEGWTLLPNRYNDGGFSGGNLERPALKALLVDVKAGKVDVIVVYKIDRLTRSLTDFSKIVEIIDRKGASFVSVTQAFNTTTSMGRLTLNVLLSFAQFEREVTGERIRDKIHQSKQLGMWMGGIAPLGYRSKGRTLEIDAGEAATVRLIFNRYLELKSVHRLVQDLGARGVVSKLRTTKDGRTTGGVPFTRGPLFHLLRSRTYLGEVPHKDTSYPGQHPAIIDREKFDQVQALLDQAASRRRGDDTLRPEADAETRPLFVGRIRDDHGRTMTPVRARKGGVTYRYYISRGPEHGDALSPHRRKRISAALLEEACLDRLHRLELLSTSADRTAIRETIRSVQVGDGEIALWLDAAAIERAGGADIVQRAVAENDRLVVTEDKVILRFAMTTERRGLKTIAHGPRDAPALSRPQIDQVLTSVLLKAEAWKRRILSGEVATLAELAAEEKVTGPYAVRVMRTAFLAPDLKAAILAGSQPSSLTFKAILTKDLPLSWAAQRALFS